MNSRDRLFMPVDSDHIGRVSECHRETEILGAAEDILRHRLSRLGTLNSPLQTQDFLRVRLGHLPHEEFHAIWLDSRHQILSVDRLFIGTIDGAQVHTREVIRRALEWNAAAVIFAHNHPSGCTDPSEADRSITQQLSTALTQISVRILDHLVVGPGGICSMAARGML